MAPATPEPADLHSLIELVSSTVTVLNHFFAILSNPAHQATADVLSGTPDPLLVLRDAASLLKAQTTKLSLLIINKPFTPSAITGVIRDVSGTCLPAMMSAVEICREDRWGSVMSTEVKARVRRVFREVEELLKEVRSVTKGQQQAESRQRGHGAANGEQTGSARDSLASTGVVWESCDALMELQRIGVVGLAVSKVEQYRDMLKDAINELKEWAEEGEDEDIDGALASENAAISDAETEDLEIVLDRANKLPSDNKELRAMLHDALKKLGAIAVLYQALIKRRLKSFPTTMHVNEDRPVLSTQRIQRLDRLMNSLRSIPDTTDELASALYELNEAEARTLLRKCCQEAKQAALGVEQDWEGVDDEFTLWVGKWLAAMTLQ